MNNKNIYVLANDMGCFATFIQTVVSVTDNSLRAKSSCNGLSNLICLMAKHAMFDSQLDHMFTSCVHTYIATTDGISLDFCSRHRALV